MELNSPAAFGNDPAGARAGVSQAYLAANPNSPRVDTPQSDCNVGPLSLQGLLQRQGAICVMQWHRGENGTVTLLETSAELEPNIRQRAEVLVAEALNSGNVVPQVFASRNKVVLVAAAIPGDQGAALTVLYPINREGELQTSLSLRARDVALVAAQLGIAKLTNAVANSQSAVDRTDTELQDSSASPPSNTPSWTELAALTLRRAKQTVYNIVASRRKTFMLLVATAAIGMIPWPHSIYCDVTCEPATRRFVAAPFDSKLLETQATAGDHVVENQLLATLDGSDLRSKVAGLYAQRSQAEQRRAAALSTADVSKSELERLEIERLSGEISLLESRQDRLEIRSPIAGVVVMGDLARVKGSPLQVGDKLFEIAPLENLVAEVSVPESAISYVDSGMPLRINLNAARGASYKSSLARIHPRNEMRDGNSVFIAEAEVGNPDGKLRPGMKGSAKISAGFKPIIWILFHRPFEAFRSVVGW